MRTLAACLFATTVVVAACSGDDGGNPSVDAGVDALTIDGPPAGSCESPATTLSTFPATFSGSTAASGADLTVAGGACADETGYFAPVGNDQSIQLTGLTPGRTYAVTLTSTADLSLYVATMCDAAGPTAGSCLAFRDATTAGETLAFAAPLSGTAFVIVDSYAATESGDYTVDVVEAQCQDAMDCSGATPFCVDFTCVECGNSFDCPTTGAPVCDTTNTCVAGAGTCTGDTTGENDNGPAAARMIGFPTAVTPVTSGASVCGTANGDDWYKFTAPGAGSISINVAWTLAADLDFSVLDATGAVVASGLSTVANSEARLVAIPAAGTYYLQIRQYVSSMSTPSNDPIAYTVTLALPECTNDFQCTTAGTPICSAAGTCVAGVDMCTGDASEPDDGPAAARDLTGVIGVATSLTGAVCNTPTTEADWYKVTTTAPGEGLTVSASWTGTADIDVAVFDSTGRLEGLSFWKNPEAVTLTHLPAGVHYIRLTLFADPPVAAAAAYTVTATRTLVSVCTTTADCATEYSTQVYRGACTAGACQFIAPGTRAEGTACDSGDDCMSGACSYFAFEADAAESVCTKACTATADCASLGAGFTCTSGFNTNICVPSCGADLDCGADTNSTPAAGDTWSYFTCTAGVCG